MKNLKELKSNDRTYGFYYAPYIIEDDASIASITDEADMVEYPDGWTVYIINEDGTVTALADFDSDEEQSAKHCALKLINRELDQYALQEAIADISMQVGFSKFIAVDSRQVVEMVISWAKEFEKIHEDSEWGINTELDYIEAIDQFTDIKIAKAIEMELGYIDNE